MLEEQLELSPSRESVGHSSPLLGTLSSSQELAFRMQLSSPLYVIIPGIVNFFSSASGLEYTIFYGRDCLRSDQIKKVKLCAKAKTMLARGIYV